MAVSIPFVISTAGMRGVLEAQQRFGLINSIQAPASLAIFLGLASLKKIPDDSIDFIWSQAVFEHIRKKDFLPILRGLYRISRKAAVSSHEIDLRDHLANALNHLRFSEKLWESEFMFTPDCYTNRIGYRPMLTLFQEAGFETQIVRLNRWERLPTPRAKLSREFRGIPDEDLCISGFSVILRPGKD
jgi:hypothetical protein